MAGGRHSISLFPSPKRCNSAHFSTVPKRSFVTVNYGPHCDGWRDRTTRVHVKIPSQRRDLPLEVHLPPFRRPQIIRRSLYRRTHTVDLYRDKDPRDKAETFRRTGAESNSESIRLRQTSDVYGVRLGPLNPPTFDHRLPSSVSLPGQRNL